MVKEWQVSEVFFSRKLFFLKNSFPKFSNNIDFTSKCCIFFQGLVLKNVILDSAKILNSKNTERSSPKTFQPRIPVSNISPKSFDKKLFRVSDEKVLHSLFAQKVQTPERSPKIPQKRKSEDFEISKPKRRSGGQTSLNGFIKTKKYHIERKVKRTSCPPAIPIIEKPTKNTDDRTEEKSVIVGGILFTL